MWGNGVPPQKGGTVYYVHWTQGRSGVLDGWADVCRSRIAVVSSHTSLLSTFIRIQCRRVITKQSEHISKTCANATHIRAQFSPRKFATDVVWLQKP